MIEVEEKSRPKDFEDDRLTVPLMSYEVRLKLAQAKLANNAALYQGRLAIATAKLARIRGTSCPIQP